MEWFDPKQYRVALIPEFVKQQFFDIARSDYPRHAWSPTELSLKSESIIKEAARISLDLHDSRANEQLWFDVVKCFVDGALPVVHFFHEEAAGELSRYLLPMIDCTALNTDLRDRLLELSIVASKVLTYHAFSEQREGDAIQTYRESVLALGAQLESRVKEFESNQSTYFFHDEEVDQATRITAIAVHVSGRQFFAENSLATGSAKGSFECACNFMVEGSIQSRAGVLLVLSSLFNSVSRALECCPHCDQAECNRRYFLHSFDQASHSFGKVKLHFGDQVFGVLVNQICEVFKTNDLYPGSSAIRKTNGLIRRAFRWETQDMDVTGLHSLLGLFETPCL
ncbi:MAG: hypothetical protein KDD62_07815 [Bdellovibrionales bacterium]|nr:hypothetical protein [Bdellovibrionales bacterium]